MRISDWSSACALPICAGFSLGVDTESELVAYATAVIAGNGPVIRISDAADQPWCLDSGVQRKLAAARRQLVLIEKHVEAQCLGFPGVVDDVHPHVVCAIAGRQIAEVVRSGIENHPTHQLPVDHYLEIGRAHI